MTREPLRERENLLVQLQPWAGERLPKEMLVPPPPAERRTLAFGYLGDMQVRLVFEQPGESHAAAVRPDDLTRLELRPNTAVRLAAANLQRVGGAPQASPLGGGVYRLRIPPLEYSPSCMLDRAFWRGQLEKFPQGLLAALPRRGLLMFAPAGDAAAQAELVRQAGQVLAAAGTARVSACVYLFDAAGWHLHSELPQAAPAPAGPDAGNLRQPAAVDAEKEERAPWDDPDRLEQAARGQKTLIYSILAGFVLNAWVRSAAPHPLVLLALSMGLGIYSLLGVVRLGAGLGKSTGAIVACMSASFVPLLNIVTWIVLSVQATRRLRAAGWRVGLLGARE